jgi:TatD DNase family protein
MAMLIDIHSHQVVASGNAIRVHNIEPEIDGTLKIPEFVDGNFLLSVGIHPWHALEWKYRSMALSEIYMDPRVILLGEIGLDKACQIPMDDQKSVFQFQAEIAAALKKPVILHVVRAMSELLEIKKNFAEVPSWIIHGFRGGRQQAEQYLVKGFYLSFGLNYNVEGLKACPPDRLFVETDESDCSLKDLYIKIAEEKRLTFEDLESQVELNFRKVFPGII